MYFLKLLKLYSTDATFRLCYNNDVSGTLLGAIIENSLQITLEKYILR